MLRASQIHAQADRDPSKTHDLGDIDSFVDETDVILCAKAWAIEWRDQNRD